MPDISDNTNWSQTDASNNNAPPNGWPEGQMPSTVNDCARADKGALKRFWDRINPVVTTADAPVGDAGGATYVYNTTNTALPSAYVNGEIYRFIAHKDSVGSDTFQVNLLPPHGIYNSAGTAIAAGDIKHGAIISLVYLSSLNTGAGGFTYLAYQPGNSAWTVVPGPAPTADYTISRASDSALALRIENANLNVDVAQHLNVGAGATITGALSAGSGATVTGALSVSAGASVTGALSVSASATFGTTITVNGCTLQNSGGWLYTPQSFQAAGLQVNGSATVTSNLQVNGSGTVNGTLTAGTVIGNGSVQSGGVYFQNNGGYFYTPQSILSNGNIIAQSAVYAGGTGGVLFEDNGGWFYTPNSLQTNGNLQVNASSTISGNGQVNGNFNCNNQVNANTVVANGITSNGNTHTNGTSTAGNYSTSGSMSCETFAANAGGFSIQCADSIYAAGVVQASNFTYNSDASLKESVADWKGGLDAVLALRPVSYTLKHDGSGHVGLIADEAEKVIPEMVVLGLGALGDEIPSIKMIDLAVLPVALVNAVKELAARVKELEAELGKR